jgi:tRNA A-37 threonylcarbamoyl transferase component Bud32/lipopolysaccharide biosynthesis regulator YciM
MPFDAARAKALFLNALDLPDPADRLGFLDRECGEDADLRQRVDQLLAAYDQPAAALELPRAMDPTGAFDDQSPVEVERTASLLEEAPPQAVLGSIIAGRYKLRQEIGEGGMGSVYLAEQLQPVKRMVALKLIKPGMDSRTVLARFESERQALALMDHPHIAKVLDAGTTEQGRPFFVMELVKGIPLTDYCDRHQLDLPTRLAIFRQICSAVQHAHQKGIIHRDLKPTNILVESHDGKPVPKVIDFGLAKATSGMQLSEHSLFTAFGSVTGTPLYMAPEQATFNALDVDTRADIYALGVILYELLTGSTPIQRDTMRRAALDEMLRVIREVEPPTPSSRISTSEGLPSLAANRHVEPSRLSRMVRGDLDWIVMKALAKERDRRYDSAIGLANDVERFLNHEPVSAGPPGAGYRMRKFVRRHRGQVAAAALVLLALVLGVVGTTLGLIEARRQERIAIDEAKAKEEARQAEAEQRAKADASRQQAERRLAQVAKMNDILGSIFKDLNPKNVEKDGKPLAALLGERLDRATAEIEGEATGDPLVVAEMQDVLGRSLLGLGYAEKAIGVLTKARATRTASLGPDHLDTLHSLNDLASAYQADSKLDRALPMYEEALARLRSKLGPDHATTLSSMNNLASAYRAAGKLDRALTMFEEVLASSRAKLRSDHPLTLTSMNNLAGAYQAAGKLDRALPLFEEVLAAQEAKLGSDNPLTLTFTNNLASAYQSAGKLDLALPMYKKVLAGRRTKLGTDHPDTLRSMSDLALAYYDAGKLDQALQISEEVLARRRTKLGSDHPDTLTTMNNLASAYQTAGQLDRALPMFEEALAARRVKLGPDHPKTLTTMNNLARAYQVAGQLDRALLMFEEALAGRRAKLGPDHPDTLGSMSNLAGAYRDAGKLDLAVPLLGELAAIQKRKEGADSPRYAATEATLGRALLQQEKWAEAESTLREALAIRERQEPDLWSTFNARSLLGAALLGQKRLEEAEPLLRTGYEGLKQRLAKIPPPARKYALEGLDRLIAFGEATGKAEEVKAWREERAKLTAPSDGKKP